MAKVMRKYFCEIFDGTETTNIQPSESFPIYSIKYSIQLQDLNNQLTVHVHIILAYSQLQLELLKLQEQQPALAMHLAFSNQLPASYSVAAIQPPLKFRKIHYKPQTYLRFNSSLKFLKYSKALMYLPWREYSQLPLFSLQWFEHFNSCDLGVSVKQNIFIIVMCSAVNIFLGALHVVLI